MENETLWSALAGAGAPRKFERDAMIYLQGTQAEEFYYLTSGRVKIFISSEDGLEKTLTILEPGRIFGEAAFFDGMPRVSSAKALTHSAAVSITRQSLTECIRRDPQLALNLLTYLSQTIRMLSAQVDSMAFLEAGQRLSRLLLSLADASGTVRATHEDLAGLAGVSRVTVSRTLARFAKSGWIKTDYRAVKVLDSHALASFTG